MKSEAAGARVVASWLTNPSIKFVWFVHAREVSIRLYQIFLVEALTAQTCSVPTCCCSLRSSHRRGRFSARCFLRVGCHTSPQGWGHLPLQQTQRLWGYLQPPLRLCSCLTGSCVTQTPCYGQLWVILAPIEKSLWPNF